MFRIGTLLLALSTVTGALQHYNIPLPEPGVLEGVVLDADSGLPLADVSVIAPWPEQWPAPPPDGPLLFPLIKTNAEGRFLRENIYGQDGRAGVIFLKDGYISPGIGWAMSPGEHVSGVTVRMKRRRVGTISGRILDPRGTPAANIAVTLYPVYGKPAYASISPTQTNDRGEYRIFDVSEGSYLIGFSSARSLPGFGSAQSNSALSAALPVLYPAASEVSKAEVITVEDQKEIHLRDTTIGNVRLGRIRLHLVNRGEAEKSLTLSGYLEYRQIPIERNADLWFELRPDGPERSNIQLTWTDPGNFDRTISVKSVFDGSDQEVEINLAASDGVLSVHAVLEGSDGSTTRYKGEPPLLTLERTDTPNSEISIRLNSDGTAVIRDAIPGHYRFARFDIPSDVYLASGQQSDRDVRTDGIEISSRSETLEIRLKSQPGLIQGKVTDGQGNPVQGATVILVPVAIDAEQVGIRRGDTTDHIGQFRVHGVIPGRYLAFAAKNIDVKFAGYNRDDVHFNHNTVDYFDPAFVAKFRDRGVPLTVEEGSEITRDLQLIE